ncbi:MAG TPA: hypothetical protein VGM74_00425, partial [Burkholderiaceae bacterium]
MRCSPRSLAGRPWCGLSLLLLLAAAGPSFGQAPASAPEAVPAAAPQPAAASESAALAARFPDPVVRYDTPAFEPGP